MTQHPGLYFLHVPRTGGTSLTAMLDARFPPERIFPGGVLPHLLAAPAGGLREYRLFRGHFGLVLPELLGAWPPTLTVLRDPRELVPSLFEYIRSHPAHYFHERLNRPGYDLSAFLRDPVCRPLASNVQARWLAFAPSASDWAWTPPVDPGYALVDQARFDLRPLAMDEPELRDAARETLHRLDVVGVTERLPETLAAIAAAMGWPPFPAPPRLNASSDQQSNRITASDRAAIARLNTVDAALHHEARRLLTASIGRRRRVRGWASSLHRRRSAVGREVAATPES